MGKLTHSQVNRLVAELVMGWHEDERHGFGGITQCWRDAAGIMQADYFAWNPAGDAACDYQVLCRTREGLDDVARARFYGFLGARLGNRLFERDDLRLQFDSPLSWMEGYRPGDYCLAALEAMK